MVEYVQMAYGSGWHIETSQECNWVYGDTGNHPFMSKNQLLP